MPKAGDAGTVTVKVGNAGGDTDDTINNLDDVDTQDTDNNTEGNDDTADQDQDDDAAKLPKSQSELDALIKKRLDRQQKQLDKKHQAELSKVSDKAGKSELELEQQRSQKLADKVSEKAFLMAATDAGASQKAAEKLFGLYKADIETDDDGEPSNLDDVIDSAKSDFEDLFKPKGKGSGDGGSGGKGAKKDPAQEWNDSIKAELGM